MEGSPGFLSDTRSARDHYDFSGCFQAIRYLLLLLRNLFFFFSYFLATRYVLMMIAFRIKCTIYPSIHPLYLLTLDSLAFFHDLRCLIALT